MGARETQSIASRNTAGMMLRQVGLVRSSPVQSNNDDDHRKRGDAEFALFEFVALILELIAAAVGSIFD